MGKPNTIPVPTPPQKDLEAIVTGTDPVESARLSNNWGKTMGEALGDPDMEQYEKLASAQIRNIFGMVRQIEMNWMTDDDEGIARRAMILLKPKLRYQTQRKKEVTELADVLSNAIDLVDRQGDSISTRDKFQRFVEFFEAILAYHKAAGGK